MTAIALAPALIEVTVFGGSPHCEIYYGNVQSIAATAILTFSE